MNDEKYKTFRKFSKGFAELELSIHKYIDDYLTEQEQIEIDTWFAVSDASWMGKVAELARKKANDAYKELNNVEI